MTLGSRLAHQLRNVLRMQPGDAIVVLDNEGFEYDVVLTELARDKAIGRILQKRAGSGEPSVRLALCQALLRREKFELVLQKCTEIGVARFIPLITQRTVVRGPAAATPRKLARWRRIVTEAAEQSGRARIPSLDSPVHLDQAPQWLDAFDRCIIASPQQEHTSLAEALGAGRKDPPRTVALLIGPEGGFSEQELQRAARAGAVPFGLGPRILRTETAAVVASALVLHELGQMHPQPS